MTELNLDILRNTLRYAKTLSEEDRNRMADFLDGYIAHRDEQPANSIIARSAVHADSKTPPPPAAKLVLDDVRNTSRRKAAVELLLSKGWSWNGKEWRLTGNHDTPSDIETLSNYAQAWLDFKAGFSKLVPGWGANSTAPTLVERILSTVEMLKARASENANNLTSRVGNLALVTLNEVSPGWLKDPGQQGVLDGVSGAIRKLADAAKSNACSSAAPTYVIPDWRGAIQRVLDNVGDCFSRHDRDVLGRAMPAVLDSLYDAIEADENRVKRLIEENRAVARNDMARLAGISKVVA